MPADIREQMHDDAERVMREHAISVAEPPFSVQIEPGLYRHYKGGLYEVLMLGTHSETEEELVIYRGRADQRVWVRPAAMFCQSVHGQPRFVRIEA